jgi:hypothetical protein
MGRSLWVMPEYTESLIELVRSLHEGLRHDLRRNEKRMQKLEEDVIEMRIVIAEIRNRLKEESK